MDALPTELIVFSSCSIAAGHLFYIFPERKRSEHFSWIHLLSAQAIFAILWVSLLLPPIAWALVWSGFGFLAIRELLATCEHNLPSSKLFLAFAALPIAMLFLPSSIAVMFVFIVALDFLPAIIRNDPSKIILPLPPIGLVSFTAAGFALASSVRTLPAGTTDALFYCTMVAMSDIFGRFCGQLFGGALACPHISPQKTWAGVVGSLALLCLYSFPCQYAFGFSWPAYRTLAFAAALNLSAQFGDLIFSTLKRRAGLRNFGTIVPGHGGILDRLDSAVLAPATFLLCSQIF